MKERPLSRAARERQLQKLCETAGGREQVLELFYGTFPDGVPIPDRGSIFDTILDHEYGARGTGARNGPDDAGS